MGSFRETAPSRTVPYLFVRCDVTRTAITPLSTRCEPIRLLTAPFFEPVGSREAWPVNAPTGMKTQYYTAASLDGFIATEDDSLDWLFPLGDINSSTYPEFIANVGALAMGSATYEWMLRNADKVAAETGSRWPYSQPAWVFTTRTLPPIPSADIRFASGDVRPVRRHVRAVALQTRPRSAHPLVCGPCIAL